MNFKELYDKVVNLIYDNRRNIVRISFSALTLLLLLIVLYFSSDNFNINNEVNTLITYIEDRQYTMAENYYDDIEKEFSDSKMSRFNKKVSKKLSALLINSADMYINGQVTKEQYMGLVNIVNALNTISIDPVNLIDIGKRVDEMYKEENITYESASSFLQITSSLSGIDEGLDEYKQHIKSLYESRQIYKEGTKNQSIKKYHEAIESYDKVLKEDEKYYALAENAKKESIKVMYNYYISQAKSLANEGKYEEALKYLSYLSPYYDEEEINDLIEEYNKYVSNYTMTSNDIISLISRRSNESKNDLSVVSYLQTVNGKRYYYGEVTKNDKVINEVLIDTETKQLYSYKSNKKGYNCNYSDAYFKIDEDSGQIIFSVNKDEAKSLLEDKLEENEKEYNSIELLDEDKQEKYSNDEVKNMINRNGNIYYYFMVKTGWFKPKEIYMVNIYDKTIYNLTKDKVQHV
ncbi:UbiD family decarboxylase [Terrisporobacter vanillatitrophus]|uniref:UbiD family decarboxylase n=1 Tax=Terrisporobacter vanillatitrophus TaxID=3058402 RepID=UPI003365BF81